MNASSGQFNRDGAIAKLRKGLDFGEPHVILSRGSILHLIALLMADANAEAGTIDITLLGHRPMWAISEYLSSRDRFDDAKRVFWEFDAFCGLYFRLRAEADSPKLFPDGKDITLQRMQKIIETYRE